MSTVGPSAPLPPASAIPSYSPLGKPVVGNETAQEKDRALPPVVQGEEAEKSRNRVESKPEGERRDRQSGDQSGQQQDDDQPPDGEALTATAQVGTGTPTIRIVPSGHAEPAPGRAALDAFNQPAIDPGLLFDQRV